MVHPTLAQPEAGKESQYSANKAWTRTPTAEIHTATVKRWCEEFHETSVANWHQTESNFGQVWKGMCFARRKNRFWQDDLVKDNIEKLWQPLADFDYVLSVYSFLEGVRIQTLQPQLRSRYMSWRSAAQIRLHATLDLMDEEHEPSAKISSDRMSCDDDLRATASKYPLTLYQHLSIARVCNDVDRALKVLWCWLNEVRNRRLICIGAIREAGIPWVIMQESLSNLTEGAKRCSSVAQAVTQQLEGARTRLCEALGLDPKQVPGGENTSNPSMTAMKYDKDPDAPGSPDSGQSRAELPRHFCLRKASLQASRIALKLNIHMTLLPTKTAQKILDRMMLRSMEMAVEAREAGDYKAEISMRSLNKKIRKVSKRTNQEITSMKPRMTLLDSETWPAVLNPRQDMVVEVHGHRSMPVETLIDMLHAMPNPPPTEGTGENPNGSNNHTFADPASTSPNCSPVQETGEDCRRSCKPSLTVAAPETESNEA
ncbi:hypothetical protein J7T55_009469 [Diaporthe amygdali]|uniref:uncharacterized protein n=1 Tax=Phomopsis amygdali TaxID=1214568 RepID=UPI0022FDBEC0|nr:uncharacterized protein J7T55_009469 [Diaporthe amygdali]KAJ0104305.1 hypothetical protein J7T55_009469 [Diaporthe amygdali]